MSGGPPLPEADGGALPRPDRAAPYLRLQSVTVFVRELDRSIKFFVEQLGFPLAFQSPKRADRTWAVVAPPDGQANLTLAVPARDSADYKLIGRHTHIAFITEDVMAKFREWRARGVEFHGTPRLKRLHQAQHTRPHDHQESSEETSPIWGGVFSRFRDPDGNIFSLVSFDEVTHAVESQRRAQAGRIEAERRAAQEIEIAKQVQSRLFPQTLPKLATLDYAGICHQARHVGGDYYDFLPLG